MALQVTTDVKGSREVKLIRDLSKQSTKENLVTTPDNRHYRVVVDNGALSVARSRALAALSKPKYRSLSITVKNDLKPEQSSRQSETIFDHKCDDDDNEFVEFDRASQSFAHLVPKNEDCLLQESPTLSAIRNNSLVSAVGVEEVSWHSYTSVGECSKENTAVKRSCSKKIIDPGFETTPKPSLETPSKPDSEKRVKQGLVLITSPDLDRLVKLNLEKISELSLETPPRQDFEKSKNPDFEKPAKPNFELLSKPNLELSAEPNFELPAKSNLGLLEKSNLELLEKSSLELSAKPNLELPAKPDPASCKELAEATIVDRSDLYIVHSVFAQLVVVSQQSHDNPVDNMDDVFILLIEFRVAVDALKLYCGDLTEYVYPGDTVSIFGYRTVGKVNYATQVKFNFDIPSRGSIDPSRFYLKNVGVVKSISDRYALVEPVNKYPEDVLLLPLIAVSRVICHADESKNTSMNDALKVGDVITFKTLVDALFKPRRIVSAMTM